jgi:hypothetical protein
MEDPDYAYDYMELLHLSAQSSILYGVIPYGPDDAIGYYIYI